MSALAALFRRDRRPVDPVMVEEMLAPVAYRGPDGRGIRSWRQVALGQVKLTITPEERDEQQPLVSPRTGCAIVADVRLDNRPDLLRSLPGQPPATTSDAELILRAYEAWGVDAARRLLGDFAFVIWDPGQHRVVCARDSYGQRTLFYRVDGQSFVAASEIQQLFQDDAVEIAPDEERLRDYLVPFNMGRNAADCARTFYAGIRALAAGHLLIVDEHHAQTHRYWDFQPPPELRYRDDASYAEHFRELFFAVVRARLRSVGTVGALVSGGLDSSSIVCTASEILGVGDGAGRGLTAYSLLFNGLGCDEGVFIRDIQAKYALNTRYVEAAGLVTSLNLEPTSFMRSPGKAVSELDAVYQAASDDGVRVLLSGEVADSCTYGTRYTFDSLLRHGRLGDFWRHLRAYRRLSNESPRKILALYCGVPFLPLAVQRALMVAYTRREFAREKGGLLPSWMPESLRTELARRHLTLELDRARQRRFASPGRQKEYGLLYPAEVGREPSGWPLVISRPYADRRLHEFLLAIPPEQKFEPHPYADELYAGGKLIVRRGLRGILPESVRTRTVKTHFASLLQDEIQRRWPDYERAFGPNGQSELARRGLVDRGRFWDRLQDLRGGDWGLDFLYVMRLFGVETWLRTFQLPRSQLIANQARQAISRQPDALPRNSLASSYT